VPGARIELLDGAGHSPNIEQPERTADLLLDFAAEATAEPLRASARPRSSKRHGRTRSR
jgi:hypothetical protein